MTGYESRRRGGNRRYSQSQSGHLRRIPSASSLFGVISPQCGVLGLFLFAAFLMGGSARNDIESLSILRPLGVVTLGFGLTSLNWEHIKAFKWLFGLGLACLLLAIIQLIPLPLSLSYALPGHALIADIDKLTGQYGITRPISLAPSLTWNAFWSMMLPLAVLVLGAQISEREHRMLLSLVATFGLLSACLGLAQTMSDQQGALYWYDDMDRGLPVGLLANRNCQAVFLASILPMLGVWARLYDPKSAARNRRLALVPMTGATVVGLCIVPIILLTGSRMGTAMGLLACLATPMIVWRPRLHNEVQKKRGSPGQFVRFLPLVGLSGGAVLVALAILYDRALSLSRLFGQSITDDLRIAILPALKSMIGKYWLSGTGLGTFKPAYRVFEPDSVLMQKIMNHAHDDWLEVVVTSGLGGALILAIAVIAWGERFIAVLRTRHAKKPPYFVRLGVFVLFMFAIASVSDYHLRTPAIACLIVLVAIWTISGGSLDRSQRLSSLSHIAIRRGQ